MHYLLLKDRKIRYVLLFISCEQKTIIEENMKMYAANLDSPIAVVNKSGICLTFDDTIRVQTVLPYAQAATNGFKITMMLNDIQGSQVAQVATLKALGHELANHTLTHFSNPDAFDLDPVGYYTTHMLPVEPLLLTAGESKPYGFGWPTGAINNNVQDYLITRNDYHMLRGYSGRSYPPNYLSSGDVSGHQSFYSGGKVCDAMSIEEFYGSFAVDIDMHKAMMDHALANNIVYITIGHDIRTRGSLPVATNLYASIEDLDSIIAYANLIGLPLLTLNEAYALHN